MAINSLYGALGMGLGQYDPYQELMRQQLMQGQRPVTREEYEKATAANNQPTAEKPKPKADETLLLLTEEE